ncbi:MAG TPA: DUF1385 domain-containing protein [Armatimonadaceae bacterium]|nr:DUF1385 domain-containing protein [Armatimonadaceae bacterium]
MSEPAKQQPMYGGQAVIEGVMMRGPRHFAVACRRSTGPIALTCEAVPKSLRPDWQKWPLLRGAFALVDSMALGTRALFWAAKVAEQDIPKPEEQRAIRTAEETVGPALGTAAAGRDPLPADAPARSNRVTEVAIGGAMVTGLLIAVGLFKVLPQLLVEVVKNAGVTAGWQLGLTDAALRFTIFFSYIGLVSQMAHVRRVFEYHGAEHKVINALEAGGPLTVEAARAQTRLHPRCGTSFIVIVLLLSVLATSVFYGLPAWQRIPIGLAMLFPVAGVAFELLRLAGKYRHNPVAAALSRPGMWTQLLTTREPDDAELEVALASLNAVLEAEGDPRALPKDAAATLA